MKSRMSFSCSILMWLTFSKLCLAGSLPTYTALKELNGEIEFKRDVVSCDQKLAIAGYSLVFYNSNNGTPKYIQTFWDLFFNEIVITLGPKYAADIKNFEVLHFPGMAFNTINKSKPYLADLIKKAMKQHWTADKLHNAIKEIYPKLEMVLVENIEIQNPDCKVVRVIAEGNNLPKLDSITCKITQYPKYITHQFEIPSYDGDAKNMIQVRVVNKDTKFKGNDSCLGTYAEIEDIHTARVNKSSVKDVHYQYNPRYEFPDYVEAQTLTPQQIHVKTCTFKKVARAVPVEETSAMVVDEVRYKSSK